MAKGSLNLRVNRSDFVNKIEIIQTKMGALEDVIQRYGNAKNNLNQFVEEGDSSYDAWVERIERNITAAKKAWTSLQETKVALQQTVDQMDNMGNQVRETVNAATEAAATTIEAAIKVAPLL